MKSPVVLVTAALTVAILLAASFLIAKGTRGESMSIRGERVLPNLNMTES